MDELPTEAASPPPAARRGRRPPRVEAKPLQVATPAAPSTCPFVGLTQDRATRFTFPNGDHRCFALAKASAIDDGFQATHCLSTAHVECPRYATARGLPVDSAVMAGPVTPVEGPRTALSRLLAGVEPDTARRFAISVLAVFGLVVLIAGAFTIAGGGNSSASGGGVSSPGVSVPVASVAPQGSVAGASAGAASPVAATSTPTAPPTPAPTFAPTLSPRPSATSTPAPSSSASPSPRTTPAPTPLPTQTQPPTAAPTRIPATPRPTARTYTVRAGDTLSEIASRFGTTVDAIVRANGLTDESFIQIGQVLIIP